MFRAAKECGVNAVKLQKRDNRALYTRELYEKPYENENSYGKTYGQHREALEFGRREYEALIAYAREQGVTFFSTVFDFPSADFAAELGLPAFKMASGDLRNLPLLTYVARIGRPMIISTGAATLEDVRRAHDAIMPLNHQLCILQCTAGYPAAFEELDLRVIDTYRRAFPEAVIGLSSHDNGIAMAVAAYVLGSRVVEKHFTLNRAMKGTDHAFSLEPVGMRKMVRDLRRTRQALGDGQKKQYPSEEGAYIKMGKSLVAARALPAGHVLTRADVAIKSPGGGLPPFELERLLGRRLTAPLSEDASFTLEMLEAAPSMGAPAAALRSSP
jgi:N-acetylneuraminate synthase/sialic acid synthase